MEEDIENEIYEIEKNKSISMFELEESEEKS